MYPIDYLYRGWQIDPSAIAVEDGEQGLTYQALVERVEAVATGLQAAFPAPSARIGVCAYNSIDHMVAILAVYAAGHVWVALNPRNGKPELDAILETTQPAAIIADADCLDKFTPPEGTPLYLGKGGSDTRSLAALEAAHGGTRPVRRNLPLDAPQTLKFTGGSTGRPKGVIHPYRCVNTSIASYLHHFKFDRDDINLCAAPLTHGSSHYILPILATGGKHILMSQPKAPALIDAFDRLRCTTAFMPPTMIYAVMADPACAKADLSSVRHLHYGAAPMAPDKIDRALEVFHGKLEVIYGQTEAPMMITAMTAPEFAEPGNRQSVGRETLLTRTAIMSPDGDLLPPGEMGEIVCRGDLLMTGYLDNSEETAKTIVDGWLHTGDAGLIDERGYLFIKDRLRDVIISGGFNVYPTDVEAALAQHPAIHDCIVFGVPDDKWGERVEAAIQLASGAEFDRDAVLAFIKEKIGSVKTPKAIHVAEELPKSAVGKVLRREARRIFASD
jgi:fatty-acyl-CoA synthase